MKTSQLFPYILLFKVRALNKIIPALLVKVNKVYFHFIHFLFSIRSNDVLQQFATRQFYNNCCISAPSKKKGKTHFDNALVHFGYWSVKNGYCGQNKLLHVFMIT